MSLLKTYNCKEVIVIYGGHICTGFPPDAMVSVDPAEDTWTRQVGVQGDVVRSGTNDRSANITISFMQTSPSNDVHSAFYLADRETGAGALPWLLKDLRGNTLLSCEKAWITRVPTVEYNREATARVWTLHTDNMIWFIGQTNT